jgi:hypothetical protein
MSESQDKFDAISAALTRLPGVVRSQMFGMPCLKVNGKAFLSLFKEDLVFKLTGDAHARALAIQGSSLFDPGMGRPMREWVRVPASATPTWQALAESAHQYVAALTAAK